MREQRISRGGIELSVRDGGALDAPTILLVHGYPDTQRCWDEVVERLTGRHHVATYDTRGMGGSSAPARAGSYALAELAADLAAVADAVSPERPVHLVGHDWGAFQCWEVVRDPARWGRIASFTAVAGPRLDTVPEWIRRRTRLDAGAWRQLAGQAVRSWYVGFFQLPRLPELAWAALAPRWSTYLRRIERVEPRSGHPGPTQRRDAVNGLALYRTNVARPPRPMTSEPIPVPVQLIVPTADRYIAPALYADAAGWATDVWRHDLRTGHWAQRTHPDDVAARVTELVAFAETGEEGERLRGARLAR